MFLLLAADFGIANQPDPVKVEQGLLQGTFEDGLQFTRVFHLQRPLLETYDGDHLNHLQNGKVYYKLISFHRSNTKLGFFFGF